MFESSGEKILDDAARDGIKGAAPFAPLPSDYPGRSELRYHFAYNRQASDDRPVCAGIRQGVYRVGGAIKAPHLVYQPDPVYSEARRAKYQGVVFLKVTVGVNGLPSEFRDARAVGSGLDEKAVEAVKSWRFEPGTKKTVCPFRRGFWWRRVFTFIDHPFGRSVIFRFQDSSLP